MPSVFVEDVTARLREKVKSKNVKQVSIHDFGRRNIYSVLHRQDVSSRKMLFSIVFSRTGFE